MAPRFPRLFSGAAAAAMLLGLTTAACGSNANTAGPSVTAGGSATTAGTGTSGQPGTTRRTTGTTARSGSTTGGTTRSGDPDSGKGQDVPFCQTLRQVPRIDQELPPEALDLIRKLKDDAPAEIQPAMEVIVTAFEKYAAIDTNDPDVQQKQMETLLDPEVLTAFQTMSDYARQTCGIDLDTNNGGTSGSGSGSSGKGSANAFTIAGLKAFLDAGYGSSSWRTKLKTYGIVNASVTVGSNESDELTADEGLEVCQAVAQWAYPLKPSAKVEVRTSTEQVLAKATSKDEGCQPG